MTWWRPSKKNKPVSVRLDLSNRKTGHAIPRDLYGIFFEDINGAADGGLYAELVQNRSFHYHVFPGDPKWHLHDGRTNHHDPLCSWQLHSRGDKASTLRVDFIHPVHPNNPNYAVIDYFGETRLTNLGYRRGMKLTAGETYEASVFLRLEKGDCENLWLELQDDRGRVLAREGLPEPQSQWQPFQTRLRPNSSTTSGHLNLVIEGNGQLHVTHLSLFPQKTFHGRKNGLRADLAEAIAALRPSFLRFPGGCIVHGNGLANAYRWKDTVGPIWERRPNWNRWGYHQSYGLGFFEYFQFCEDIGAQAVPILPCGISCGFAKPFQSATLDQLQPWINDCLDLIEFANGPATSRWGSVRSAMGHPEPFHLKYLGVGNEEHDSESFRTLFPHFTKALRERHPEIVIIGTSGLGPEAPLAPFMKASGAHITDEHYYEDPEWFVKEADRFDRLTDSLPVYIGEYASRGNRLVNATSEAAYLIGIERNSDRVVMHSYAPLLAHFDFCQWKAANMIWFDDSDLLLTPNYHVQKMFREALGDYWADHSWHSPEPIPAGVRSSVTINRDGATTFLKFSNPSQRPIHILLTLEKPGKARQTTLSGKPEATNRRGKSPELEPHSQDLDLGKDSLVILPANSVSTLTVKL